MITDPNSLILLKVLNVMWKIFQVGFFVFLLTYTWRIWLKYRRMLFISQMKWSLIEVRIPKEVFKSPLAMELVLMNAMHYGSYGEWYWKFWQGRVPPWFSLEIVSIEGNVYFFILTPVKYTVFNFKDLIEAQIYAEYPQAEINEVPDYTETVSLGTKEGWGLWGAEFVLSKADPFPIKTYIDYGVDRAVSLDENQKIDPITGLIETFGSLGEGEQMWLQILIRKDQKRFKDPKKWFGKRSWTDVGKEEIENFKAKFKPKEKGEQPIRMSPGETNTLEALERSINKPGFDCGIRVIYLAKKGKFRVANIAGIINLFKPYGSTFLNGFKISNKTGFDVPWQDYKGIRATELRHEMLDAYKLRSYFYPPHDKKFDLKALSKIERVPFILNSEELATIFHFPGSVSETPTFKRMTAKKSEPPTNLPI